jgi:hypothetical protein
MWYMEYTSERFQAEGATLAQLEETLEFRIARLELWNNLLSKVQWDSAKRHHLRKQRIRFQQTPVIN